ncbi:hypothetical protein F5B22DRAFT_17898 [Xylaria bambusicola]|uniref:uncharacterized protein n=1 Tax=Xylaria bambusicola TaxID=326684 RepID=UPI0020086686|nr:uncharacterized protein F5B22DRAFT_17898 [Xylaria bambusicola]KAI0528066.1 hypothetical protein F5B22DRAFT_17898 [Xylaria bambusicola]
MSASDASEGSTNTAPMRPSETAASYFPKDTTVSTIAPTPSAASTAETSSGDSPVASSNPLSPMDREYAEPLQDFDIAQQLSKQPAYWSIQGWLQRSASSEARPIKEDAAARRRKFEEAKRDLLASAGRF